MKYLRRPQSLLPVILLIASLAFGQAPKQEKAPDKVPDKAPPISKQTKTQLMRLLNYEFAWVRKPLPQGDRALTIKQNGEITPDGADLTLLVERRGLSAKPGDHVQITN